MNDVSTSWAKMRIMGITATLTTSIFSHGPQQLLQEEHHGLLDPVDHGVVAADRPGVLASGHLRSSVPTTYRRNSLMMNPKKLFSVDTKWFLRTMDISSS